MARIVSKLIIVFFIFKLTRLETKDDEKIAERGWGEDQILVLKSRWRNLGHFDESLMG